MEKISLKDHVGNEEVLCTVKDEDDILHTIMYVFFLKQFMYSYCCLCTCILIVSQCILIVVYVFLLFVNVFLLLSMYTYSCPYILRRGYPD